MRFVLILLSAMAVSVSIHTLKQHGIEPASLDFWACLVPPCTAGALVVLISKFKKKGNG